MYSSDPDEARVPPAELHTLVESVFLSCGMDAADASLMTQSLVAADLRGVHSHGVLRVPDYVKKLTTGGVDPKGRPRIVRDNGACLVVDGGNSMGQIGTQFAMTAALGRAQTTGLCAAAIGGSNHNGALAFFAQQALPKNMIGIVTTNTSPTMVPTGSSERIMGINPLAVAIPAGDEPPMLYDAAFSASSHGKLRVYHQKGLTIPEGWALDADGKPTTDPSEGMNGSLLPIGGFKGMGLALIMGVLSTALSGADYGTELMQESGGVKPGRDGHFVLVLRVNAFEEEAVFKARMDTILRQLRTSRPAPNTKSVYAPGDVERLTQDAYLKDGIPLNAVTLADLRGAAEAQGVALPAWLS
jgi:LDH2 family malate/lactate/ureidoglycolate dehydrogenase